MNNKEHISIETVQLFVKQARSSHRGVKSTVELFVSCNTSRHHPCKAAYALRTFRCFHNGIDHTDISTYIQPGRGYIPCHSLGNFSFTASITPFHWGTYHLLCGLLTVPFCIIYV